MAAVAMMDGKIAEFTAELDERYTWNVAMLRDLRAQHVPQNWFISLV